jgi:hypothetical protein
MLAFNTGTFTATGYDSDGHEVPFVPASWSPYPWDLGTKVDEGVTDGKPFYAFKPTSIATGEIRCAYNDVIGVAKVTCTATIETVTITPNNYPYRITIISGTTKDFTAHARASGGLVLTIFTPTWVPNGGVGTITSTNGMIATFTAGPGLGIGSIEAIVGGVTGEVRISVEASS